MSAPSDRRRLLQSGLLATGGLLSSPWQAIPPCLADAPARPKFRFVQLNDMHVQAEMRPTDPPRMKTYARANDKLAYCVNLLNTQLKPDFVLAIGDLIQGEALDRLALDLQTYQTLIKPLVAPLYPTLGNHENVQKEGNAEFEQPYRDVFGDQRVSYTFEHGGLRFIMLNNSGAAVASADVTRARNQWLRETLVKHASQPTILGCHIPLIPLRDEPILAKSFRFRSYQAHDAELLELVDSHAEHIVAVLSGHLHLTGYVKRQGVHHISICGTASYPSDFASFDVFDDRIEMTVHQLPAELANAAPTIHGRPKHPQDYTDSSHETADIYQTGRTDERRLKMLLKA